MTNTNRRSLRIGLVVPHIFMQDEILPSVIFSPGQLALCLADGLQALGHQVTLFTPDKVQTTAHNITADSSLFRDELQARGDTYLDLLRKHPLTFISLARQLQSELIAKAYEQGNADQLDIVHIYTNEEEIALPFAQFCHKPVAFTHHDPFNFLPRYRAVMPKYAQLNWISMSYAQRRGMPSDTNWIGNIYHGLDPDLYQTAQPQTKQPYVVFMGRIIESKGLHLAIEAVKAYNQSSGALIGLKIAGKHYSGAKDDYWQKRILPLINDPSIEYLGYVGDSEAKNHLLAEATALIVPSTFEEPFGMVMIEALASGTPIVGLDSGAISEVVKGGTTGVLAPVKFKIVDGKQQIDEAKVVASLAQALTKVQDINRSNCRKDFLERFTLNRMCQEHVSAYWSLIK